MGRRAAGFRRRRYRDRPRCRGAPGRLLRHPVQVLRARYADLRSPTSTPSSPLRPATPFTARIVVGHRRRLGAERPQDHRAAEARLHRAPFRRNLASRPFDWPGPGARRTGRPCLPPRTLPPAAPPKGRVRRRDRRLQGPRSRQARHGLRRRQDLYRIAHRGSGGGASAGGSCTWCRRYPCSRSRWREWATQRATAHRYVGVCSDTRAGRNDEDASLQEA